MIQKEDVVLEQLEAIKVLGTFVVLDPGATLSEKEIEIQCQRKLESFMVPKMIVIVAELPKTTTGKIRKRGLT